MRQLLTIVGLIFCHMCFAQNNAIDKYFGEYQKKYDLDVSVVSGKMLSVLVDDNDADKKELDRILSKISSLKIMSRSNGKNGRELFNAAVKVLPASYETILAMNESERKVKCYTLDKDGKTTELVMVAWQWGRFMILSITGDIDVKEIFKLSQKMDFGKLGR